MPGSKISTKHEYTRLVFQINGKLSMLFNRRKKESLSVNNPFVYVWNIPWYHWIKMLILTIVLMPFRIVLFLLFFSLSLLISYIATSSFYDDKPMHGWRKKVMLPLFLIVARATFFFGGLHWISVKGQRCSREQVPILVLAPHSAFLDALIVVYLGMNSVVGKVQTSRSSVGSLLKMTQPVLVNRDNPNSRQKTIDEIKSRCNLAEDWPQMLIFPEGTCTNRSCLINFKTGAFMYGLPVQPVILRWPNKVDNVTWTWEGPGIWTLLWMTLTQFHTSVEIEFLPPYLPSYEESNNPRLFADNVRSVMAKKLNIPTNNFSYEDCRHMTLAKRNGLPFAEIIVEFSRLSKYLSLLYGGEEEMLNQLINVIQNTGQKKVTSSEFCNKFNINGEMIAMVECIFKFYDKSKSGSISLKDLVSHMSFYVIPSDRKKAFLYAYKAFKQSFNQDDCTVYNDTLRHTFMLTLEEVNELFTVIQSQAENNLITFESIDEVMQIITDPFNMYRDYFDQYNACKRSKQVTVKDKNVAENV